MTTLLGDYWYGHDEYLPSAALVRLLGEFDVTDVSARAALSRLSRRGLLVSRRSGRNTAYRLSEGTNQQLTRGIRRVMRFAAQPVPWDGQWTFVAFTVPEQHRPARLALRSRLRFHGFAFLYDGLWVSPHPPSSDLDELLASLPLGAATVVRGTVDSRPGRLEPISAWDLGAIRQAYADFVEEFSPLRDRVRSGAVTASDALRERTAIMGRWRAVPEVDPELPHELLPDDWPRYLSRELFAEVYDVLAPLALARVRQILAEFSPELASLATHQTTGFVAGQPVQPSHPREAEREPIT